MKNERAPARDLVGFDVELVCPRGNLVVFNQLALSVATTKICMKAKTCLQ